MISRYHLSPYRVIVLLVIFPVLYVSSLWLTYFIGILYFLISLTYFTYPPTRLPSGSHQFVLYQSVSVLLCLFCSLDSTYKTNHMVFVFLCLIYLSIIPSGPSMLSQMTDFIFKKNKFIYFWLCWVFVAACRLSLVAASGDYSSLRSTGSRHTGFSSCGARA